MRHIWSEKRWDLVMVKTENGKSFRHKRKVKYRLHPIDTTRYPPERLVQIRARKKNFRGEVQR